MRGRIVAQAIINVRTSRLWLEYRGQKEYAAIPIGGAKKTRGTRNAGGCRGLAIGVSGRGGERDSDGRRWEFGGFRRAFRVRASELTKIHHPAGPGVAEALLVGK